MIENFGLLHILFIGSCITLILLIAEEMILGLRNCRWFNKFKYPDIIDSEEAIKSILDFIEVWLKRDVGRIITSNDYEITECFIGDDDSINGNLINISCERVIPYDQFDSDLFYRLGYNRDQYHISTDDITDTGGVIRVFYVPKDNAKFIVTHTREGEDMVSTFEIIICSDREYLAAI